LKTYKPHETPHNCKLASEIISLAVEFHKYALLLTLFQSLHTPTDKRKEDPLTRPQARMEMFLSDGYGILISGGALIGFFKVTRKSSVGRNGFT